MCRAPTNHLHAAPILKPPVLKSQPRPTPSEPLRVPTTCKLAAARRKINNSPKVAPQNEKDRGKLTVVLDVDETLIHSRIVTLEEAMRLDETTRAPRRPPALESFTFTTATGELVHGTKRPGLDRFLAEASKDFEIMAYTAGLEAYARPLLDWLDPDGSIFRHRLFRDSCLLTKGHYLKDLLKVNRPMKRVVLVDNNALCFVPQLSNGIPIRSFYNEPGDTALSVLHAFLSGLRTAPDVRPVLAAAFKLHDALAEHRSKLLG